MLDDFLEIGLAVSVSLAIGWVLASHVVGAM